MKITNALPLFILAITTHVCSGAWNDVVLQEYGDSGWQWIDAQLAYDSGEGWIWLPEVGVWVYIDRSAIDLNVFSLISAGVFTMGSPLSEYDRQEDEKQHEVTLTRPFYMKKTEVTVSEWIIVRDWAVGNGYTDLPDAQIDIENDPDGLLPVVEISWYDAIKWCNAKSEMEGLTPCYYKHQDLSIQTVFRTGTSGLSVNNQVNWGALGYRLPTESEWEYACRAGTTTAIYSGEISGPIDYNLDGVAWYFNTSNGSANLVGGKLPNDWDLYDMHGNVWEWCWDGHGNYPTGSVTDPHGASGDIRIFRGGYWGASASLCRSARRSSGGATSTRHNVGFRPVRLAE